MRDGRVFLAWWVRQLVSLVPPRLRLMRQARAVLVVDACAPDGVIRFIQESESGERILASLMPETPGLRQRIADQAGNWRPRDVVLRLPAERILTRSLRLPQSARSNLEGYFSFEMDRLTPFQVSDLFWDWTVVTDRAAAGGGEAFITVDLSVVLKAAVAPLMAWLEGAALRPDRIEALAGAASDVSGDGSADGAGCRIRLGARRAAGGWPRVWRYAVAGVVLLPLMGLYVSQSVALWRVRRDMAQVAPAVAQVHALQRTLRVDGLGARVVAGERARDGDLLFLVGQLSRALPDDTYLTDLALRRGKVRLTGQSASTAGLIGRLSATPGLADPSFSAPISHAEAAAGDRDDVSRDVFSLQAAVEAPR